MQDLRTAIAQLRNQQDNNFAMSLVQQYDRKGSLSEKQEYWVHKLVAQAASSDDAEVIEPYYTVLHNIVKDPGMKLRFPGLQISRPRNGKEVLYLTSGGYGSTYYGKIDESGRWMATYEAEPEAQKLAGILDAFIRNPVGYMAECGHQTGICCVCGRTLTDPKSIEAGIGPICASKF